MARTTYPKKAKVFTAIKKDTPTPIRAGIKKDVIAYLKDNLDLYSKLFHRQRIPNPFSLNVIIEILYLDSQGKSYQHLKTLDIKPSLWSGLSNEASEWAGLSTKNPYVDVEMFPKSTFLKGQLHRFSGIARSTKKWEDLLRIIQNIPEL